jgi:type I restriction enzyme S subunit
MIKIDKSSFKTYKFGDIVSNISERAEPKETKLDIYVGLEHLDPDCIHIKRKGHPSDVKGTKLRVYPGDIIFGKRRAYQRKAAIVDFDGICSAHAMVVRTNPKVIFPELLPFFMHSDAFMHRAVDVSEGSLSPTIKWKILADQDFKIPSLNDQKRIAELLWSIDSSILMWDKVLMVLDTLYKKYGQEYLLNSHLEKKALVEVANINMGQSPPGSAYNEDGSGMPFLQGNAEFGEVSPKHIKFTSITTKIASKGDILLSVRAPVGEINIADRSYCIGRGLSALSMKDKDLNTFLRHVLIFLRADLEKKSTGSTFKAINKQVLEMIGIPFGDKDLLLAVSGRLEKMTDVKKQVQINAENIKRIQKQIINQMFG